MPDVLAAMLPYFTEHFGNRVLAHGFGTRAGEAVKAAREQVQALIGAEHSHRRSFHLGRHGIGQRRDPCPRSKRHRGRNEVIVSAVEHPAVLALVQHLAKHRGIVVRTIPVDGKGRLDVDAYRAALGPKTAIASIMWANNETGTIFPVAELAALAHEAGALFHTDAVQAVGRVPLDVKSTAIDMLSLSAHKLHGPKGIGALYVRKGVRFHPLIRGGKQERGRRAGTENVPGDRWARQGRGTRSGLRLRPSRARGRAARLASKPACSRASAAASSRAMPQTGCPTPPTSSSTGALGEVILTELNKAGIAASSGSACASGSTEPSHVLRAMKVPYTAALGAIRFSFQHENTADRSRARAWSFARGRGAGPRGFRLRPRGSGVRQPLRGIAGDSEGSVYGG